MTLLPAPMTVDFRLNGNENNSIHQFSHKIRRSNTTGPGVAQVYGNQKQLCDLFA